MKVLIALWFCGLSTTLSAQPTLRIFTDENGVFRFKYPPTLIHCVLQGRQNGEGDSWVPAGACSTQDGVCDDEDSAATTCFAYPKGEFTGRPAFDAAAFFVAKVSGATTPKTCLEGSPDWLIQSVLDTTISSVSAKVFQIHEAGLGSNQEGGIYRVFHDAVCYELGIQETTTSPEGFDPGTIKEFTKRDAAQVRTRLKQSLNSFTFSQWS